MITVRGRLVPAGMLLAACLAMVATGCDDATVGGPRTLYITTMVGTGVAGQNGDGKVGRATNLYLPQDVTMGPDGYLYFIDWNNHRIRRIGLAHEDVVETIVGTGELGDARDAPADEIKLNHPTNVSFDSQGRMLIAAWHNSLVKRLDFGTGFVENLAGTGMRAFGGDEGPGNLAKLDLPSAVAEDSLGNIVISDQANFRIRLLDTEGMIHTIAGTGVAGYSGDEGPALAAQLKSPVGQSAPPASRLIVDASDNIWLADTGNHVVRRIDAEGIIHTVAGTGTPGYSGDGGPAIEAELNTPNDVAIGPDGSLYIADTTNNVVRRVDPAGIITTVAGTGERGHDGDGGPAAEAMLDRPYGLDVTDDGRIYVADTHNNVIRLVTPERVEAEDPPIDEPPPPDPCEDPIGKICSWAGTGREAFNGDGHDRQLTDLYWPIDVEFTPSGRTYLLDWNNHRVREIESDGTLTTVIGTDFVGDGPLDQSDLAPPGAPGTDVLLNHPTDLQELPNGDLLLVAWHNHKLRVLDPETGLVTVLTGAGAGYNGDGGIARTTLVNQPSRGVLDRDGNFLLLDQRNQRIRIFYDFATERENAIAATIVGTGVGGFNGDGLALDTQVWFPFGPNPEPGGAIALDAEGRLYFSDTLNNRIRQVHFTRDDYSEGFVTTIAGTGEAGYNGDDMPATEAQVNFPQDMEIGPDGNLYFADTNNHRIRMIDLQTDTIHTVAGTGEEGYGGDGALAPDAQLNRPFGVAFGPDGALYVSDTFNSRVRRVQLTERAEPILPEDYGDSYVEVRDCRFSIEHGGVSIRVLTNPESAAAYLAELNPLPAHTVVVKEEFDDPDCTAESLVAWRVQRKEDPGFDPAAGDWHWQHLDANRNILFDDKATCIGCHMRPECVARDFMCTLGDAPPIEPIEVVLGALPAALVSIAGTADDDVYAVGADSDEGLGPLVLHYDGSEWQPLDTGATGDLWWISDRPIDGDFWMAGEGGLILRYDPDTGDFEQYATPGDETLFGIWGTASDDIWAVGGDLANEDEGGVIWHFDGSTWEVYHAPDEEEGGARGNPRHDDGPLPTLYKVWGRSSTEAYAVGRLGVTLLWNGSQWSRLESETVRPLFTVHGNANHVVASGGFADGVLMELEAGTMVSHTPAGILQMNGVAMGQGDFGIAVGLAGEYAIRTSAGWAVKDRVDGGHDFHGAWVDPAGGLWAVGGDLSLELGSGVVAYGGRADVGD